MLFVFQVDTGRMMTFDMSLALESVQNLKTHVELAFKIPVEKQVLLISGGEHLRPEDRVCSYAAGTDTNPIFLFSKSLIQADEPPAASVDYGYEHDLSVKVRESSELPATYTTVQKRAQLARVFCEASQREMAACEKLVHEQHLQQQGWASVLANLEDLSSDLKLRWKLYKEAFHEYIEKRDAYLDFLKYFKHDLDILQKIPVLPALIEKQKSLVPEQSAPSDDEQSVRNEMTLYEWISDSQRDNFLECLFDNCSKGLQQTDQREFVLLQKDIEKALESTENMTMKEIKGLSGRLCKLEEFLIEARSIVSEQVKIAESFQRNQSRASQVKEASVLPDLCATHVQQLNVLLENFNQVKERKAGCMRSKDELSGSLYHRLKWVVFTENSLSELDNKLVFFFENLLNLQRQLEILQQVHTAPATYLSSIVEVVRRRKVSQAFLPWASHISCQMFNIYNDEIARRKDFQVLIEDHFLSSLFPGMDDLPPSFAIQAPSIFDSSLPKLTEEDVDRLRRELPEMAESLEIPDTSSVTNYFILKEDVKDEIDKNENKTVEDKLIEVVAEAGLASNLDQNILKAIESEPPQTTPHGLPHLKDLDRGCESETDTEEFEKVGQSPFDLHFDKGIPSLRPGTQDASTLTEDNLQISRSEYEKVKTVLGKVFQLSRQTYTQLRSELVEIKTGFLQEKAILEQECDKLKASINNIAMDKENREREIIQRLTVDHELEISDFRKIAQSKNEEIRSLRDENVTMTGELKQMVEANEDLKRQMMEDYEESEKELQELLRKIEDLKLEKEKCVKETTDALKLEHRNEMENIRARFRLMTMERSPSENSLEKIERGDFISGTFNEAVLRQMTEKLEIEKDEAVQDAVSKEAEKWQKVLDETVKQMEVTNQQKESILILDIQSRLHKDQEKQITQMREQINNLNLECMKYKTTIQQLADCREESEVFLASKVEILEKENAGLKEELENYRKETTRMAASVAVCEGAATVDAATSPVKSRKRSEIAIARPGKLNIDSCKPGDLVLVVWDISHQNYKILQESSCLYFLNADCLESLGLRVVDGQPNRLYCYAEVVEKEYCHARKPVNRFRVPQGTKFFRVKVRPPPQSKEMPHFQPAAMSQSQTTTSSSQTSDVVTTSGPSHSSLPSSPSKGAWEKSESQEAAIPEEMGEDADVSEETRDEDVERGTELTENFNVDNQSSIDRSQICVVV